MMYYKRNTFWGRKNMKPRIFVSSTFYDLKYIREDLSNYIKAHDFEPILFEDGDIGYVPGKKLDESCYENMKSADIVVLIIGGNYGSPATGEIKNKFEEYMSITRKEFKKAVDEGIPLYVFIENKVYAEYEVYEANYEKIERKREIINFKNTKDINVFRFIKEIKSISHISITEFEKVTQIKDFLSKQWSDMFKQYLDYLKLKQDNKKVETAVDEMKTLIKKMNIMLDGVGKKILTTDDSREYEEVIELQNIIMLASEICDIYDLDRISMEDSVDDRKSTVEKLLRATDETLEKDLWVKLRNSNSDEIGDFFDVYSINEIEMKGVNTDGDKELNDFSKIYKDNRARELLIQEMIKDENYQDLIYRPETSFYLNK